jgi:GNAT superfamily N-acetyltransferase
VLLPQYRGQGVGHRFFDIREDHARQMGRRISAFCAVIRPKDHPQRPEDYHSLEPFWRKRGYAALPDAVAQFRWKDVGHAEESTKSLQFWTRTL